MGIEAENFLALKSEESEIFLSASSLQGSNLLDGPQFVQKWLLKRKKKLVTDLGTDSEQTKFRKKAKKWRKKNFQVFIMKVARMDPYTWIVAKPSKIEFSNTWSKRNGTSYLQNRPPNLHSEIRRLGKKSLWKELELWFKSQLRYLISPMAPSNLKRLVGSNLVKLDWARRNIK